MKRVILVTALLIGVLAFLYYTPAVPGTSRVPPGTASNAQVGEPITPPSRPAVRPSPPPDRSSLADALNSPATDIHADLRLLSNLLETFRSNFQQSGNPVGNNAEITESLTGRNKLRLSLIPPDHPAINQAGELCDRWGTPFFFHAESATRMEIRSAGPDKKIWTDDDVTFVP